jgi:hypothetical protein
MKWWTLGAASVLISGCATLQGKPDHLVGLWGGPHAAIEFEGGLAEVQFDCASGTLDDPIVMGPDGGKFQVKGTYRAGAPGPVRVGQIFKSQPAGFSGEVVKHVMTLNVMLEDGTALGPFTLTEGSPPQLTRCL